MTPTPPPPGTLSHQEVFRRTARRVLVVGLVLAALALAGGGMTGGQAWSGALWGAGAGAVLTIVTAAALAVPWDRYPLLASSGVMISFAAKIVVMVAVVVLAGPYKASFSAGWFFASLAVILLAVTAVEVGSLATGRTLTVQPPQDTGD
ncbi:hypothetical protein [Actinomyces urogenitalis]|uniref:hypothetical protein n=1 Tax=Actinomyces urogenitalis TaxID=103621 RepID=UPI00242E79E1|nr:hypothetical protein [Actinomyces urogenitalis]MCI7456300.1 hypothetical protein [Actinomyces urogenitalis]